MKTIFLLLLLVSAVYSIINAILPTIECKGIQAEKCKVFAATANSIECKCTTKKDKQYAFCTEFDEELLKACEEPSYPFKLCNVHKSCEQNSPTSLACADFCSAKGSYCDIFPGAFGSQSCQQKNELILPWKAQGT